LRIAFEDAETDPEEWEGMIKENEKDPEKYAACSIPAVWGRGIPLKMYVGTPMHLLFLGVAKAVFLYVGIWLHCCGRKQGFQVIANTRLQQLDNLKLCWLLVSKWIHLIVGLVGSQKNTILFSEWPCVWSINDSGQIAAICTTCGNRASKFLGELDQYKKWLTV
jgi:hypothetical protein